MVFTSGIPNHGVEDPQSPRYQRVGPPADARPGIRLSRMVSMARVTRAVRDALFEAEPSPVLHGHHVDGALACRLASMGLEVARVAHAHTALRQEFDSHLSCLGHVLDRSHLLNDFRVAYTSTDCPKSILVPPVVPLRECLRLESCRTEPDALPTAVYLGNPDAYQNLVGLVGFARTNPEVQVGVLSHHSPDNETWSRLRAFVSWRKLESVDELLGTAASAWWGLCPRRVFSGYPFKAVTYTGLGLPTLAPHDWGPPAEWHDIAMPLETRSPPPRIPTGRLRVVSVDAIARLKNVYQDAILSLRGPSR